MDDDATLLRRYAATRDDDAFAALVRRHVDFVHSVACRRTHGDAHLARDVSQQVFLALARRAAALARHPSLLGWLHTCACQRAADLVRAEARRRARETTAATDPALAPDTPVPWETLAPEIDLALAGLAAADRETVLLRYFAQKPFADIAATLGTTEAAAQMRTARALEKLRRALAKRGVTSTASALGLALGANAVTAAPASVAISSIGAVAELATTGGVIAPALLIMKTSTTLVIVSTVAVCALGILAWRESVARQHEADLLARIETVSFERNALQSENRRLLGLVRDLRAELSAADRPSPPPKPVPVAAPPATEPRPPFDPAGLIPVSAWQNKGAATPRAALESLFVALDRADPDAIRSLLVLEGDADALANKLWADLPEDQRGTFASPEAYVSFLLAGMLTPMGGMHVAGERADGSGRTTLTVQLSYVNDPARPRYREQTYELVKTDDGWRWSFPKRLVEKFAGP
jgi:RNA polymerase sigma factor (sigma-70 family)